MTCIGDGGRITKSVTVTVAAPPSAATLDITASPSSIKEGESTTISWNSDNTSTCTAGGDWTNNTNTSGSQQIGPLSETSTFTMSCAGAGGTASNSVTVTVSELPTPVLNISSTPSSISEGENTTISWNSENTITCSAVGGWTNNTNPNGSERVSPLSTRDYRITCQGEGGGISKATRVTVTPSASVDSAELSWTPPTTSADGSSLDDLAGFTIHYGTSQNNLDQTITVNNPSISSYIVNNLTGSIYYFSVSAFDESGNHSENSSIVSKSAE